MVATIEVHLEWPEHAIRLPEEWSDNDSRALMVTMRLFQVLKRHHVKATWYVLGIIARQHPEFLQTLLAYRHSLGSHGYWHRHGEYHGDASDLLARRYLPECIGYRSPFWDTTPRPCLATGGAAFHILPYSVVRDAVQKHQTFYLHPHDLYDAKIGPWRRRLFVCDPWKRLDRLLDDIEFMHV